MIFPDGTHALRRDDVRRRRRRVRHGRRPVGLRQVDAAADRLRPHPRRPAASVDVDRTSIGYVFQDATLLQWRTVQRNVELLAELEGMPQGRAPAPGRRERSTSSGWPASRTKYPKQLSGGMKMRASLARSLVLEPKVFLFDEPFGALDEITRERLNDELIALFQRKRLRRPVHHPLDQRGRVPVDPGARDVRPPGPDRRRLHGAVRLPALARPALRARVRRAVRRGLATPCEEPTCEHRRRRFRGAEAVDAPVVAPAERRRSPPTAEPHERQASSHGAQIIGPVVAVRPCSSRCVVHALRTGHATLLRQAGLPAPLPAR